MMDLVWKDDDMAAYQCLNCHQIESSSLEDCCDRPDLFCINDMPEEIVRLREELKGEKRQGRLYLIFYLLSICLAILAGCGGGDYPEEPPPPPSTNPPNCSAVPKQCI